VAKKLPLLHSTKLHWRLALQLLDTLQNLAAGQDCLADYFLVRITPTATDRRSRSGSFNRAFSAASFVLNGFDNGVN
jgi:hypothetical protein